MRGKGVLVRRGVFNSILHAVKRGLGLAFGDGISISYFFNFVPFLFEEFKFLAVCGVDCGVAYNFGAIFVVFIRKKKKMGNSFSLRGNVENSSTISND